jgi:hypothetical protein
MHLLKGRSFFNRSLQEFGIPKGRRARLTNREARSQRYNNADEFAHGSLHRTLERDGDV